MTKLGKRMIEGMHEALTMTKLMNENDRLKQEIETWKGIHEADGSIIKELEHQLHQARADAWRASVQVEWYRIHGGRLKRA